MRAESLLHAEETAPGAGPASGALPPEDSAELPRLPRRRGPPVWAVASGVTVVVLAAGLLFPVPVTQVVACTLETSEVGAVKLPAEGAVALAVAPGVPVKAGDQVGTVTPRVDGKSVEALRSRVRDLEARQRALAEGPAAKVQAARRAVASAQAAVDPLLKQRAKLEPQKTAAAKKKLAALDRTLKPKVVALEKARAALEAVSHAEARAALDGPLAEARKGLAAATTVAAPVPVLSPASGLFVPAAPVPEGPVGAVVARLVAPGLQVRLQEPVEASGPVTVTVAGAGAPQVARDELGGRWVDGAPVLAGKACTASVPAGRRPFVLTLL